MKTRISAAQYVNAAVLGNLEIIRQYFDENKNDPTAIHVEVNGISALQAAILAMNIDMVHFLLINGAKPGDYHKFINAGNRQSREIAYLIKCHRAWKRLHTIVARKSGELTLENIAAITSLSAANFERFVTKVDALYVSRLLTTETLLNALHFVSHKVPSPAPVILNSKIKHGDVAVEHIFDNGHVMFSRRGASRPENRDNIPSFYGTISRGFNLPVFGKPDFAVKRFYNNDAQSFARREARGLELMGRKTADLYNGKNGPIVVTDYLHGETLHDLFRANYKFEKYSKADRLKIAASLFADIEVLNDNGLMHGDATPQHVKFNGAKLTLLDFSTTRKIGSSKIMPVTVEYMDGDHFPNQAGADMFDASYSLAILFPELFYILSGENFSVVKRKFDDFSNMDAAIINLFDALSAPHPSQRCTAKMAKQYCLDVAAKARLTDYIDSNELVRILRSTINRDTYTEYDALLGCKRPGMFADGADQAGGFAQMLGVQTDVNRKEFASLFHMKRKSKFSQKETVVEKISALLSKK